MILFLNFLGFFAFLVLLVIVHELGHYLMAKELGYKPKEFGFVKGDFVIKFPSMPVSVERKVLFAGILSGFFISLCSFIYIGVWGWGLVAISLIGSRHDILLLWKYRNI